MAWMDYSDVLWYVALRTLKRTIVTLQCSPGVCGTDGHVHEGEFIASFPVELALHLRFVVTLMYHFPRS